MKLSYVKGLVSVIIPVYNNAQYLRRCIDSLLAQRYQHIELVVVDDGSEDDLLSAVSGITDERFRGVINMPHSGVSTTRNVGIEYARGEYMVFIDGDDWVEEDYISLLMSGLNEADCAMVMMSIDYPDHNQIDYELLKWVKKNPCVQRPEFNLLFEKYMLSSPCNKIYRTQLIKQLNYLRFDSSVSYAEDLLFNLEYFGTIETVSLIPKVAYHYVKHSDSSTTRFHNNTSYTLNRLSTAVSRLLGKELSKKTLGIMMKHYLWGIFNLHHKAAHLTSAQIKAEICQILSDPEYLAAKPTLCDIGVSHKLQMLLRTGNPYIIHAGFRYYLK